MTDSMFQFEPSNIQNILIALVVICAIVYGFIEFRKINIKLSEIESKLSKMNIEPYRIPQNQSIYQEASVNIHEETEKDETNKNDISNSESNQGETLVNKIINQVEDSILQNIPETMGISETIGISETTEIFKTGNNVVEEDNVHNNHERIVEINEEEYDKELDVSKESNESNEYKESKESKESDAVGESFSYTPSDIRNSIDINDPILELTTNTNYDEYSIKELKNTLEDMGLSTSGNKTKLIERIISNKK